MPHAAYNAGAPRLRLTQRKTDVDQVLHVPPALASMEGRHHDRLLATPRGEAWTTSHEPTALVMDGQPNRVGRALTGHQDDASHEGNTAGSDECKLARPGAEAVDRNFGDLLAGPEPAGNQTSAAGLTGRAAAKAKTVENAEASELCLTPQAARA